jgi:hypothetical protein
MADNYIFLPSTFREYRPDLLIGNEDWPIIWEIHFGPAWEDGLFGKRGEPVPYSQISMVYGDDNRARYFEGMAEYVEAPRRIRWDPNFNDERLILRRNDGLDELLDIVDMEATIDRADHDPTESRRERA